MPSEQEQLRACLPRIVQWYAGSRRLLPWRQAPTPYHVWISEIMLQQTRIEAATAYYERFVRELPTVEALAAVDEDRLLKLWEGLGYYSRARNLKKAALLLVERYGGQLPREAAELKKLPGIGDYTAGAIASIAYGRPEPAVD
ncbi:MAG: A/G-specific adenine glycosylase, partial [Oscillospiraceae bacterium]|nr:A/G-specific adenine glycosylase [Oscillospiraceae bacterium]